MANMIGSKAAADILGVDRATITRWALEGKISYQKLDGTTGAYVFDISEVERLRDEIAATA
jgi:predicted site-specific integrase-resolvase